MASKRFILKFIAANGFTVVLEFPDPGEMETARKKIEAAGLSVSDLQQFNPRFEQADLFMDLRSPECRAQFNLQDWIIDEED